MSAVKTINMIAAALGGEGGGVFTNWMIAIAEHEGWLCQTTSLAGVAQRTGATIYYLEFFPRAAVTAEPPVMSLFPAQGDIDIAVASEIAEAGRMVQRGFVTPDRTTLIASDHRVYGISEKIDLGDGIVDAGQIRRIAGNYARAFVHYDMAEIAEQQGAVISAVMLGGLASAQVLPFAKDSYIAIIKESGVAVATNLAAFESSYERASSQLATGETETQVVSNWEPDRESSAQAVELQATTESGQLLLDRIQRDFPQPTHEILWHGLARIVDYQDYQYAAQYLDHLDKILQRDDGSDDHMLTRETARWLALWMCYEDIPRVAQLKTRAQRFAEIRSEVKAEDEQLLRVTEFFRPRIEEMCAIMPASMGERVLDSAICRRVLTLFTGGRQLHTTSLSVFLVLRMLAGLRRFRRGMLGYKHEHQLIERWLSSIAAAADGDTARALADCGRLIKGYGETRFRTTSQMTVILDTANASQPDADGVSQLLSAALEDDEGTSFSAAVKSGAAA